MTDLHDLISGKDEVRCTSYLALLMSLDPSRTLVRRFMELARDTWAGRRKAPQEQPKDQIGCLDHSPGLS
jgi:hypothetical protein